MSIIEYLRKLIFLSKIRFYKVNRSINKIDDYDKYLKNKVIIQGIQMEKVVEGVLTISIPKNMKYKVFNVMLISE